MKTQTSKIVAQVKEALIDWTALFRSFSEAWFARPDAMPIRFARSQDGLEPYVAWGALCDVLQLPRANFFILVVKELRYDDAEQTYALRLDRSAFCPPHHMAVVHILQQFDELYAISKDIRTNKDSAEPAKRTLVDKLIRRRNALRAMLKLGKTSTLIM